MIPANRQIHAKLEIIRPSGRVDVTPYLEAAEVELGSIEDLGTGTGADIGVHTLTFSLRNDGQRVQYWDTDTLLGDSEKVLGDTEDGVDLTAIIGAGKWARHSFAPRDKQSDWNVVAGEWEPLLWPYRGVVFQVAVTAPGMAPNNWITLFEGYLGDNITTEPHMVTARCRDKSKRLQDAYIDIPKTYTGPMAAETLIQAIINDYVENPPQLYCPVASGITFDEMKVEYVSVWDAIQNVAKQMGWFLGYRWNGSGFVLTFMEPPRSKNTADFLFNWEDDIYHETLDISDADIRNVVTVVYRDKATGERKTVTVSNPGSIEEYTKRAMQIEEADTSLIDNYSKAYDFAQKCLWDLSELSATDKLDMPLLPELDLFSTFAVTNPLISSTTDFFAVQSVRHSLDFRDHGRFRTEVIATGRVVGARKRWTDMETRPGRPGQPIDPDRIPPGELPVDRLPDYSIGVDKFMENLKPVILVSELPILPDPRFPIGTIVYLITEGELYKNVDDTGWVPLVKLNLEDLEGKLQSNQIELEAIKEELIAAEAIASRHIQIEAVTTEKIAHEAVRTEHIDTGAITETKISDNAISAPKIKAGAIEADKIAANAVTAAKIAANAVTANKIAAGAVETEKLAANAVTAEKIAAGAIQTNHISAGAVKADQIDANAVTASKILAGAVTAVKIAANAVTTNKINAGAVTAEKIAAGAIQTRHLEAGAVTADKLYVDTATTNKIIAGIAQIGGLSADYIKAGTITADRLAMPTVRLNIPSVTLNYQQKTNAVINLPDITFVGVPMIGSNMEVPQFPGVGESNAIEVRDSGGENSGRAYIETFSRNKVVLVLKNESAFGSTRSYEYGSAFVEITYMEN